MRPRRLTKIMGHERSSAWPNVGFDGPPESFGPHSCARRSAWRWEGKARRETDAVDPMFGRSLEQRCELGWTSCEADSPR